MERGKRFLGQNTRAKKKHEIKKRKKALYGDDSLGRPQGGGGGEWAVHQEPKDEGRQRVSLIYRRMCLRHHKGIKDLDE